VKQAAAASCDNKLQGVLQLLLGYLPRGLDYQGAASEWQMLQRLARCKTGVL